jgi:hypothetical protein
MRTADRALGAVGLHMRPRRGAREILVARDEDRAQFGQRLAELHRLE